MFKSILFYKNNKLNGGRDQNYFMNRFKKTCVLQNIDNIFGFGTHILTVFRSFYDGPPVFAIDSVVRFN